MDRGQTDCNTEAGNDCMVCLGGCRLDSKQSMLVTFLAEALAKGLELRPEVTVETVEAAAGRVRVRGKGPEGAVEVISRRLVLAGGSLGNSQILSCARDSGRGSRPSGRASPAIPRTCTTGSSRSPSIPTRGPSRR
jgi:hypothetical protein